MTRPKVPDEKRQRTAQACDSCKRRKQKVSHIFPTCLYSIAFNHDIPHKPSIPHSGTFLSFPLVLLYYTCVSRRCLDVFVWPQLCTWVAYVNAGGVLSSYWSWLSWAVHFTRGLLAPPMPWWPRHCYKLSRFLLDIHVSPPDAVLPRPVQGLLVSE